MVARQPSPGPPGLGGGQLDPSGGGTIIDPSPECTRLRKELDDYEGRVQYWKEKVDNARGPLEIQEANKTYELVKQIRDALLENYKRSCLIEITPSKPFSPQPWELVTPLGIQLDDTADEWDTGSIWTVLPLDRGRLLVGTEQGGLWLSEPDGSQGFKSACLSDAWPHWQIYSMIADPRNPARVFVGFAAGGLYVGDMSASPIGSWERIALPWSISDATVYSMIILPTSRLLVVATGNCVAWLSIDAVSYQWQGLQFRTVNDIANLSGDKFLITDPNASENGLVIAEITQSNIAFTPAPHSSIRWSKKPTKITFLRVASCRTKPQYAYCAGNYENGSTRFLFVIRSTDSGLNWEECQYTTTTNLDLSDAIAAHLSDVKSRLGVAVHPTRPEVVAIGWAAPALSFNSGNSWDKESYSNFAARHADVHEITFDDRADVVHIPSDGGLISVLGWKNPPKAKGQSLRNRTLPIVLLYAWNASAWSGNLATSDEVGFIVAGSQDNGNLWCTPGDAWKSFLFGDGGYVALGYAGGHWRALLEQPPNSTATSSSSWQGAGWRDDGIVPIRLLPQVTDGSGLVALIRPVSAQSPVQVTVPAEPSIPPKPNSVAPVFALGAAWPPDRKDTRDRNVYGAVFSPISSQIEWIQIGTLPDGEKVSALEAYSSQAVLAGTVSGRLFLVTVGGGASEIPFASNRAASTVGGIASIDGAILVFRGSDLFYRASADGALQYLSNVAFPRNGQGQFRGIAVNRNPKFGQLTHAVTLDTGPASEVWVSNSPIAAVWHRVADGLPNAVRCSDLAFSNSVQHGELYLSTYGRGVWRLRFDA